MKDFQRVLAWLRTHSDEALTVNDLLLLLGISARTVDYWIRRYGLPPPFFQPPDRQRYWRPADLISWVQHRERLSHDTVSIEGVCERTGATASHWRSLVKRKAAPASIAHELGTGRQLWWISEVDAYLMRISGGVRLPRRSRRPRSVPRAFKHTRCQGEA